jgi:hypothetical protein
MTLLATAYRSTGRPCRWCRLRIVSAGAGDYCASCQPIRDIALNPQDYRRAEALELLLADEPAQSSGVRAMAPNQGGAGDSSASPTP